MEHEYQGVDSHWFFCSDCGGISACPTIFSDHLIDHSRVDHRNWSHRYILYGQGAIGGVLAYFESMVLFVGWQLLRGLGRWKELIGIRPDGSVARSWRHIKVGN